jgi:hypothetical protein
MSQSEAVGDRGKGKKGQVTPASTAPAVPTAPKTRQEEQFSLEISMTVIEVHCTTGTGKLEHVRKHWGYLKSLLQQKFVASAPFPPRSEFASKHEINSIRSDIKDLKDLITRKDASKPAGMAWARVAGSNASPAVNMIPVRRTALPARHKYEVIVSPGTQTIEQLGRNPRELVEGLRKATELENIAAARRLLSGDVLITTLSEEAKKSLEMRKDWDRLIGDGAKVKRRHYTVVAQGMPVKDINPKDQKKSIREILDQNEGLKGAIEIPRFDGPKRR